MSDTNAPQAPQVETCPKCLGARKIASGGKSDGKPWSELTLPPYRDEVFAGKTTPITCPECKGTGSVVLTINPSA